MPPDPLPPGFMLGHYRIDAVLHQGAAGRFYRAFNTNTRATVALNVLDAGARNPKLALEILETIQGLARTGDAGMLDLGVLDGAYYVAVSDSADESRIVDVGRIALETLTSRKQRPISAGSRIKLVLLVVVTMWACAFALLSCAVGFLLAGGFSPPVALVPASAILLAGCHAAVGWAQRRWSDLRGLNRHALSGFATLGFGLGLAAVLMAGSKSPWLTALVPSVSCVLGLAVAMRFTASRSET